MKEKLAGVFALVASAFVFLAVYHGRLEGVIFLLGMFYGLVVIFHERIAGAISSRTRRPLFTYGLLVFVGGMLLELAAYCSNLPKIQAGQKVYLFSPKLGQDLLIGFPHYVALGLTWAWLLKRYRLSAWQQALLLGLFWGIVVDNFSHFRALLSGQVLDFIVAGLLLVFALNWPLVILQGKLDGAFPRRVNHWTKFPIVFLAQVVPMLVLIMSGLLLKR